MSTLAIFTRTSLQEYRTYKNPKNVCLRSLKIVGSHFRYCPGLKALVQLVKCDADRRVIGPTLTELVKEANENQYFSKKLSTVNYRCGTIDAKIKDMYRSEQESEDSEGTPFILGMKRNKPSSEAKNNSDNNSNNINNIYNIIKNNSNINIKNNNNIDKSIDNSIDNSIDSSDSNISNNKNINKNKKMS